MTTNQKTDWTAGRWPEYPWPGGCANPGVAARSFVKPKDEWRKPLERWLPGYRWPARPDRAALERILMAAPFNLRPADFNSTLPIDRAITLLIVHSQTPTTSAEVPAESPAPSPPRKPQPSRSPAMSIKQLGKALIMDPYRVFKPKAMAEWDLKPDKDAHNKWTIDYILLNDPGKQRQIEERAAFLRDKQKKSSAA